MNIPRKKTIERLSEYHAAPCSPAMSRVSPHYLLACAGRHPRHYNRASPPRPDADRLLERHEKRDTTSVLIDFISDISTTVASA